MLSDSTNAEVAGKTAEEGSVGPALEAIVRGASGRVLVSCFASSTHRIQLALDLAAASMVQCGGCATTVHRRCVGGGVGGGGGVGVGEPGGTLFECPLCRETLGREVSGTNDGSYSLVEWTYAGDDDDGDGDGGGGGGDDDTEAEAEAAAEATSTAERVDAAWLRRRMREFPAVSEPGRRPHERWLARRAAEKAKRRATDHED